MQLSMCPVAGDLRFCEHSTHGLAESRFECVHNVRGEKVRLAMAGLGTGNWVLVTDSQCCLAEELAANSRNNPNNALVDS